MKINNKYFILMKLNNKRILEIFRKKNQLDYFQYQYFFPQINIINYILIK